jgi:D-alanyl-D-alanine carboxypeptidase
MKRVILALMITILTASFAVAQEESQPVGIDAVCGEEALTIVAADDTADDAGTQALDTILRQFVTLPSEEYPALVSDDISRFVGTKPPAPGAVIFVDAPGTRYYRSIGVRDVETCAPVDPTMQFPIGSNTKMFTASVILQLHEEGLLSIDDLVSDYLPEEIALWEGTENVTIGMLLTHTSGLPDYLNSPSPESIGSLDADPTSGELETAFTPRELIDNAAIDPLLFEPGAPARWAYSNTGYIMLGMIIEQVTGQSYIEAVNERVIEPLGLENTVLIADTVSDDVNVATQYLQSPWDYNTTGWHFSQAWSAGNIVSTPEDMATFLRAHYSGDLFQNEETLDILLTRAVEGNPNETDDFYYMHGGYHKHDFLGHGGQTLGTMSDVGYNPDNDVVIVTWANSAEAVTGQGVYVIGSALGLTPTLDDLYRDLIGLSSDIPAPVEVAIADVLGVEFQFQGVYLSSTAEFTEPAEGTPFTLTFVEEGQMTIVADCNTIMASYTADGDGTFSVDLGASTLVACPEESIADDFLTVFGQVTTFELRDLGEIYSLLLVTDDNSSVGFSAEKQ